MSRYTLKLKQNKDKYLSPWKVSHILDSLTSEYYKKYVLDQLTEELKGLSENQFPFIVSGSFDLYNKYSKLKSFHIKNREDVENFYYLGDIVSLKPDIELKKLEIIFKLHRVLYTDFNSIDIKLDRGKIIEYITPNLNPNKLLDLESLSSYVQSMIYDDDKNMKVKVTNRFNEAKKEFKYFVENDAQFEIVNQMDENEFDKFASEHKNRRFINEYYNLFFTTFTQYSRPIVAIFDKQTGYITIIGLDFIKESLLENNEEKIEVKKISKNSPILMDLTIGYIASGFLAQTLCLGLGLLANNLQNRKNADDVSIGVEVLNLRKAISDMENYAEINRFNDNLNKIDDFKIKKNLEKVNSKLEKKVIETLDKNDFLNGNLRIDILDSSNEDTNLPNVD